MAVANWRPRVNVSKRWKALPDPLNLPGHLVCAPRARRLRSDNPALILFDLGTVEYAASANEPPEMPDGVDRQYRDGFEPEADHDSANQASFGFRDGHSFHIVFAMVAIF